MPSSQVSEIIAQLPWRMRETVGGYVDSVEAALPDILREMRRRLSDDQIEKVLVVVTARRIWAAINGQHWIIDNSLSIASQSDVTGFQVGRDRFEHGSEQVLEARDFRTDFQALLSDLDIEHLVTRTSIKDIIRSILSE